jgi:hypothetical protein
VAAFSTPLALPGDFKFLYRSYSTSYHQAEASDTMIERLLTWHRATVVF